MHTDLIISMGVFADRDENGIQINTDALLGLEMVGEVIYDVDLDIGIQIR